MVVVLPGVQAVGHGREHMHARIKNPGPHLSDNVF